jgi:hypothetical protein
VVSGDLRFPEAEGERTPEIERAAAYLARYREAAHHDPELVTRLLAAR